MQQKNMNFDTVRMTWIMVMLAATGFAWILHHPWPPLPQDTKLAASAMLVLGSAGFLSTAFGKEWHDEKVAAYRHWRACHKLYGTPLPSRHSAFGADYNNGLKLLVFDLVCETIYGIGCLTPLPWGFVGLLMHLVFRVGFSSFYENRLAVIDWDDKDALNTLYLTEPAIDAVVAAAVILYMFVAK